MTNWFNHECYCVDFVFFWYP